MRLGDTNGRSARRAKGRASGGLAATLGGLVLLGCADITSPAPAGVDIRQAPAQQQVITGESTTAYQNVLRQSASAPLLQSYQVSFWAVRGTNRSIEVRYQPVNGGGVGDRYVRFTVPNGALVTDAAGNKLGKNDSLLITLTFDPVDLQVDFEPSGLSFSRNAPARLEIWYLHADPDANRDGVVNSTDQDIFDNLLSIFHYDRKGNSTWTRISSSNDKVGKTVSAAISGFSGYAIAW